MTGPSRVLNPTVPILRRVDIFGDTLSDGLTIGLPKAGRGTALLSFGLGLAALIAACFMPVVVAYDDERARQKWEQTEPVEILGLQFGKAKEFVPPSERGETGSCVILFMIGIVFAGGSALLLGVVALFGPAKLRALLGAGSGVGGVLLGAWLTPMGLWVLVMIAIGLLVASVLSALGFSSSGGGC